MEGKDSPAGLPERAYSITKAYHRMNLALIWMVAFVLALCITYLITGLLKLSDQVTRLNLNPILGSNLFGLFFMFIIIMSLLAFTLALVTLKGRKTFKDMKEWGQDYLYGAYVLNFATSAPSGNTTVDRILSIARLVFPELRNLRRKRGQSEEDLILASTNKTVRSYSIDLALPTSSGLFILKEFRDTQVTISDIKQLCQTLSRAYGRNKIFRIVVLAKKYDETFLDEEILEKEIKGPSMNLPLDALQEHDKGYAVLRVASAIQIPPILGM